MAVLSRLIPSATSAYLLQAALALIFVPQQNEKYYDLGGAAGFLSTSLLSLYYPALKAKFNHGVPLPPITSFAPRQLLVTAALGLWSARLGSFLVARALKAGGDSRFDEVKKDPKRFSFFWFAQATWVFVVGLPVYLVNTVPPVLHPALSRRDYLALGLFAGSFLFEVIADRQKTQWRRAKDAKRHDENFISSGLWAISRHPNYVGEVGIHIGIWALATGSLTSIHFPTGTAVAALASPLLTYFLLRKVSGVPPLEKAGDKKFGADPKWQQYKRQRVGQYPQFFVSATACLFPPPAMISASLVLAACAFAGIADAHPYHDQQPMAHDLERLVDVIDVTTEPWGSKFGLQTDLPYSGPLSFAHLPYSKCLEDGQSRFDIAILGLPFDTTTSYRPGARFGPTGIRIGSRRQHIEGYTLAWNSSPHELGASILDCGDVPLTPVDNAQALEQMEVAYTTLLNRPVQGGTNTAYKSSTAALAKDGSEHPRLVTLGGDHTIVLPILRSLNKVYGPVSVIHFDAHLDTWAPPPLSTGIGRINHGSFFAIAAEEHLIANNSIHGGIRCHMGRQDIVHDTEVGFQLISAEDIDDYGVDQIISKIRQRVGNSPVYLSLDIDVIDPGLAPATGTPEVGGWTTPDITSIAAAEIIFDFLNMMQMDAPPKPHVGPF
ncbi:unnamed protein product [Mycena citricolor]|uniref:Arginase/deacetylase n=1 Tax=Mycena citricolor TaxID=2018698 RepID=A0AAD2H4P2_9AGAR|nr:unnamed protein product [Mycena citricolor]